MTDLCARADTRDYRKEMGRGVNRYRIQEASLLKISGRSIRSTCAYSSVGGGCLVMDRFIIVRYVHLSKGVEVENCVTFKKQIYLYVCSWKQAHFNTITVACAKRRLGKKQTSSD